MKRNSCDNLLRARGEPLAFSSLPSSGGESSRDTSLGDHRKVQEALRHVEDESRTGHRSSWRRSERRSTGRPSSS